VNEHQRPLNRYLHFAGTFLALLASTLAVADENPWWLLGVPVFGYVPAWLGHLWVERNRPLSFSYPLWGLMADLHMFALMCLFRMDREVKRMKVLAVEG
jgi:hypothetical protein